VCVCRRRQVGLARRRCLGAARPFPASLHRPKPWPGELHGERQPVRLYSGEKAALLACLSRPVRPHLPVPHLSPAIPISCNTLKHHISPPDHLSPSPSPSAPRALIYPSPSALPRPTAHRPKGSTDHEPPLLPGLITTDLPSPVPAPPCQLDPSAPGLRRRQPLGALLLAQHLS
jgi:hypothetical protein